MLVKVNPGLILLMTIFGGLASAAAEEGFLAEVPTVASSGYEAAFKLAFAESRSCYVDSDVACLAKEALDACGGGGTCMPTRGVNISYATCSCR